MKKITLLLAGMVITLMAVAQLPSPPDKIYGDLFREVQMNRIFPDGKTFVDCIPKRNPKEIMADYHRHKTDKGFNLKKFVDENFTPPKAPQLNYVTIEKDVVKHIKNLWSVLKRSPDSPVAGSSLLPLPYPYIVPGGRFREIYYWDSYFTMLGLQESGETQMIENMINNFAYLINQYGFIPNGNRSYYLSRSQPPYFSVMVELLAGIKGNQVYAIYLPALEKEYAYWMDKTDSTQHVVAMPDGSTLNRYYDRWAVPREESYREDVETAKASGRDEKVVYRNLRSGAECGIDFSSRWFADGKNLTTIQVLDLIPVDLNCLLYHLEITLARAYKERGNLLRERYFAQIAERRKQAINKYCWSEENQWYVDYNFVTQTQSPELTISGMAPLFFNVAPDEMIPAVTKVLEEKFVQPGGVVTSLKNTGEQWDAPNGWPPLEWLTIKGLENYKQHALAKEIAERWMKLNIRVFHETGKLMEKYDVMDIHKPAGGGEYPSQDGFGWTNGVLLKLISMYGQPKEASTK